MVKKKGGVSDTNGKNRLVSMIQMVKKGGVSDTTGKKGKVTDTNSKKRWRHLHEW